MIHSALHRHSRGFTIVEILIVIVIIGILATLVMVNYQGTQTRARTSQWIDNLNTWEQLLRSHQQATGDFAVTVGGPVCLGSGFPAADGFAENQCHLSSSGDYDVYTSSSFNDSLSEQVKPLPETVLPIMRIVDTSYPQPVLVRGLTYFNYGNGVGIVYYADKKANNGKCMRSDELQSVTLEGNLIECIRWLKEPQLL